MDLLYLSVTDVLFHYILDILNIVKEYMLLVDTAEQKDTLKQLVASLDICLPRITILLLEKPDGHQFQKRIVILRPNALGILVLHQINCLLIIDTLHYISKTLRYIGIGKNANSICLIMCHVDVA